MHSYQLRTLGYAPERRVIHSAECCSLMGTPRRRNRFDSGRWIINHRRYQYTISMKSPDSYEMQLKVWHAAAFPCAMTRISIGSNPEVSRFVLYEAVRCPSDADQPTFVDTNIPSVLEICSALTLLTPTACCSSPPFRLSPVSPCSPLLYWPPPLHARLMTCSRRLRLLTLENQLTLQATTHPRLPGCLRLPRHHIRPANPCLPKR